MTAYTFEALDALGHTRKGQVEAESAKAARSLLRTQTLIPLRVDPVVGATAQAQAQPGREPRRAQFRRRVFSATQLAIWTRQIAGLVAAGLPLERALTSLSDEAEDPAQGQLVAALRAEVSGGATFAKALGQHPREFSAIYTAVIGAGEQSGHLGLVLEHLADDLEERLALRARLIGAALYPLIVTLVAIMIVLFLVTYVVPQVATVFAGSQRSLPWLTVAMLGLSSGVRSYGWVALGLLAGGALGLRYLLSQVAFRHAFDAAWLKLPLIGRLARGYNAARFANTLAMLTAAGVPILKALLAAAGTLSNQAMRADAMEAIVLVREGAPLATALARKPRFPALLAMFARLGEQTGQLPLMLGRAARQLSTEVQRRAMQLATLLEPLLIVAMGAIVMLIVLAVLLPIIQLNQWVR